MLLILSEKLSLLSSNMRLLPFWVYAAYACNLGLMAVWHVFIRKTAGFTVLMPSVIVLAAGILSNIILARLIYKGIPQSLLMPLTVAMGPLIAITVGILLFGEPASTARLVCLFSAIALIVIAGLV